MTEEARELLRIAPEQEVARIAGHLRQSLSRVLHRQGVVVAISGGVDSSVTAAIAVRAVGNDRVLGLLMPERESSPETVPLSRSLADWLGIRTELQDITSTLDHLGCYQRRDAAFKSVVPEYGAGWKAKIVLPPLINSHSLRYFSVVAQSPSGDQIKRRLPVAEYLSLVAATNFKQRVRKMLEYYFADCCNYAVCGTPNRLEYDLGFFVKLGDGAADAKPIAHLYKSQVYQLAEYLGVPREIRDRAPTTDTYSLQQSQEEFYFSLPYDQMDLCLYGKNNEIPAREIGRLVDLTESEVASVYRDIEQKRRTTEYLHSSILSIDKHRER